MIRKVISSKFTFKQRVLMRIVLMLPIIIGIASPSPVLARIAAITGFVLNFLSIEYIYGKMRETSRRLEEFNEEIAEKLRQREARAAEEDEKHGSM